MKKTFKHCAPLLLASLGLTAHVSALAADWRKLTEDLDGSIYLIDTESIAPTGKNKKAWFWAIYKTPQISPGEPSKPYQSTKTLYYFNCQERTMAGIQWIAYKTQNASDVVSSSNTNPAVAQFVDPPPDSIGEALLKTICTQTTVKR